ncbi:MAG: TRAP transporter small permease [Alphaproteobacteria bacterium]|nr:TRAP transporter small permease [Alphaproteobacteria bacterium]
MDTDSESAPAPRAAEHSSDDERRGEEILDDISDVRWFEAPALVIFAILFFIVALPFFTRYVLNDSLGWTEEIARYFLILLAFSGSVICVRKNRHIFLEFLHPHLPRPVLKFLLPALQAAVCVFFAYCGWLAIELAMRTKSSMVSVDIPKSVIHYAVSVCCFFMAFFALVRLARLVRGRF